MMITENILSFGFVTSIVVFLLAMTCLFMAHRNQADRGRPGNPLGLPPNVQIEVRVAQYLMLLIGVLMEHEIPDGLEMIGKGMEQLLSDDHHVLSMRKILLSSLLRLCMGYMFLLTLFVAVVQSDNVLDLFFNVLALEFVENIDTVIFALSRRGFFGRTLRKVANKPRFIVTGRETYLLRRYTKRLIKITYAINISIRYVCAILFCFVSIFRATTNYSFIIIQLECNVILEYQTARWLLSVQECNPIIRRSDVGRCVRWRSKETSYIFSFQWNIRRSTIL
jgi:hypothetical protein